MLNRLSNHYAQSAAPPASDLPAIEIIKGTLFAFSPRIDKLYWISADRPPSS